MVYTILISVVFIAEIIITITIIQSLLKLDKSILELNDIIHSTQEGIKEIAILTRKISEELILLSEEKIKALKKMQDDEISKQLSKLLLWVITLKLNIKFINKIRKTKLAKLLGKGLSLLEFVI